MSQQPAPSCARSDSVIILAPTTAFLDEDEARWLVFVNLRSFWVRDHQEEYERASDHIVATIHRYLDAIPQDHEQRLETFATIAEEVNEAMAGLSQIIVPNGMYRPDADWDDISDRISTKPFLLGNLEGVAGAYASLGRFLTCRHVGRLQRCSRCNGLFIAPTDAPWAACPQNA